MGLALAVSLTLSLTEERQLTPKHAGMDVSFVTPANVEFPRA